MLTETGCRLRRERLFRRLPDHIEWALIADSKHVNYFSSFWVDPLSQSLGERSFLFLERTGKATLFCDNAAYASRWSDPFIDDLVKKQWYTGTHWGNSRDTLLIGALEILKDKAGGKTGAVENNWFPVGAEEYLPGKTREAGLEKTINTLRKTKDADEVDLLTSCIRAGDVGIRRLKEYVQPGIREYEVYREVQNAVLNTLGRPVLVYGDFRAASPDNPTAGGPPGNYRLRKGETFIADFTVVIHGYRSDTTATVPVEPVSPGIQELIGLSRTALISAESRLKPGCPAKELHSAVSETINTPDHPGRFPHHGGHGIGLGHPEPPFITPKSTEVLETGNVIALEPGAYEKGIGGVRLEHNYLITGDGFQRLSCHSSG